MTRDDIRLPAWARCMDGAALALLVAAAHVGMSGGFAIRVLGLRLSARSPWRAAALGALLLVVRHLLLARPAVHTSIQAVCRRAVHALRRMPSDRDLLSVTAVPAEAAWRRRALDGVGALCLFAGLTVFMTYPQIRHLGNGVSPDTGDPLLSTWRLSWIAHQVVRDPLHLFDANIFYPARYTLAFSDSILLPGLTAAPLVWAGVPQLVAYNLLLLSGFALSGVGMFLLVRSLTGSYGAAFVSGFVFAFLPFRFMHYAHLELVLTQWMPLCLWALHRTAQSGRTRDGLLTGLFFALQTLSCIYYGIFFATFLAPFAAALLLAKPWAKTVRALKALGAGAILAGVLLAPIVPPYLAARASVGERPLWEIEHYSARPHDYLAAHPRNLLLGDAGSGADQPERALFLGFVVPLVALLALWPPLSGARVGYAAALLLALDVSLGLNGVSYAWLHAFVLPYRGLRVPARMAMLVGLSLSVLVGYAVARMTARRGPWAAGGITLAIGLLVFGEYRSQLDLGIVGTTPPPIYDRLRAEPGSVLLELPLKSPDIYLEPVYMYFSTFHWHKLVNGYSGFSPVSYGRLLELMATFPDRPSLAELRRRDVRFVIVHGDLFDDVNEYEQTLKSLDHHPDLELVASEPWQGRQTRLYRLRPDAPPFSRQSS